MADSLLNPNILRPLIFFCGLALFLIISFSFPYRGQAEKNHKRSLHNVLLFITNVTLQWIIKPLSLMTLATWVESNGHGIFHHFHLPKLIEFALSLIILDFIITLQHVFTHKIPLLWRLHRVHHTDIGFDTTTALRFHPLETFLSLGTKAIFVMLLGVDPFVIVVFEALINFSAMFNHSNFTVPKSLDKIFRLFIVTPEMHRAHHSIYVHETNSNYGFFLSIWDRIFSTYTRHTQDDSRTMMIGLSQYREDKEQGVLKLLQQPFNRD
jgi:sterol desaturase/sphingolipid hydroxylase (fatty acid hydroxylase superfamily)